ncbi:MAG: hypothetical protein WKF40_07865 [Thermoleophilaceae bacterium]
MREELCARADWRMPGSQTPGSRTTTAVRSSGFAKSSSALGTLGAGHLLLHDLLRELVDRLLEEARHPLLLLAELLGQLRRVAVAHRSGQRLDRPVVGDLLGLVGVLRLGVLQHLLGLARSAYAVKRTLCCGHHLVGHALHGAGRLGHHVRPRSGHGLGLAAELLDAPLDALRLRLRLLQVILQALLVRVARGQADVGLQRGLELLLFSVRLVQVLDDLHVAFQQFGHGRVLSYG